MDLHDLVPQVVNASLPLLTPKYHSPFETDMTPIEFCIGSNMKKIGTFGLFGGLRFAEETSEMWIRSSHKSWKV